MWFAGKKWADFLQRGRWITLLSLSVELAVVQSTDFYRTSGCVCKWIEESFSRFLIRNLILKWDWDIGTGQEQATLHEVHSQRDRSGLKNEEHCSQYCGLEYPVDMSGNMHIASKLQELLRLEELETQKVLWISKTAVAVAMAPLIIWGYCNRLTSICPSLQSATHISSWFWCAKDFVFSPFPSQRPKGLKMLRA